MSEQTVRCKVCGDPYVVYSHYAGDQSACPDCRAKARRRYMEDPDQRQEWPKKGRMMMGGF